MTPATNEYDDLGERAGQGNLKPVSGTAVKGEQAALLGREILLAATGSDSFTGVVNVALGQPRLSEREAPRTSPSHDQG